MEKNFKEEKNHKLKIPSFKIELVHILFKLLPVGFNLL